MRNSLALFRLQTIDHQILIINDRIKKINTFIEQNGILSQAENQASYTNNIYENSLGTQKILEGQLGNLRIKIEQGESTLYDGKIKNPKDLRDLEKELGIFRHNLVMIEDSLLDAMEIAENNKILERRALSILLIVREKWSAKFKDLEQEIIKLQIDLRTYSLERDAIIPSISHNNLSMYEHLQIKKQGFAVCCIRDNTCLSCGTSLTLAFTQTARSSEELVYCPSCGRIIYSD